MNLGEEVTEDVGVPRVHPGRLLVKGSWQQRGDLLHRQSARKFPGIGTAHAVTHRKHVIVLFRGGLAEAPETLDFPGVESQAEKGILVVRTDPPTVGPGRPLEAVRGC